jgi:hypothetical protein
MNTLDDQLSQKTNKTGSLVGTFAAIALVVGALGCVAITYAKWQQSVAMNATGAPDGERLSAAVALQIFAEFVAIVSLFLGTFAQRWAFVKFEFRPRWMWMIQLVAALMGFVGGLWTLNWAIILLSISLMIHVMAQREAYHDV